MAMTARAIVLEEVASFETRQMRVLSGGAARARANAKRADGVKLGLAVVAILVYMLGLTVVSAKITAAGAEINSIKGQIAELENEAAIADMTIGAKSSLERVEAFATGELGMVYPDPSETYFLSAENSQAIAAGRLAMVAAATESDAPEEDVRQGPLGKVSAAWRSLTDRSAQAAEVGAD